MGSRRGRLCPRVLREKYLKSTDPRTQPQRGRTPGARGWIMSTARFARKSMTCWDAECPRLTKKCPANRRATVSGRWFGGCAGSEGCCAPNDDPATVLYAPRAAWFVNRTIPAFAATHACPDPQPVVRCSARARRRREPWKPGQPPSAAPDSFRSFTSIAPRRTHSAPVVYWS